jgi:TonB family protein
MRKPGRVVLSCVFVLLSACASMPVSNAQMDDEVCAAQVQPPVPEMSDAGIEAPSVIRRVEPVIGANLRGRDAEATVEAIIGEDGTPRNVCVIAGDAEWGRAAAAALRKWQFKPGTRDGKPVPVRFTLTTSFTSEPRP